MNLARLLDAQFRRVPASLRGTIVFRDKDGNEATAEAIGVPARGEGSDGFTEGTAIRDRARRLSVRPKDLAFPPRAGMTATWEGTTWSVLGVSPLDPAGSGTPALYRVTLQR